MYCTFINVHTVILLPAPGVVVTVGVGHRSGHKQPRQGPFPLLSLHPTETLRGQSLKVEPTVNPPLCQDSQTMVLLHCFIYHEQGFGEVDRTRSGGGGLGGLAR